MKWWRAFVVVAVLICGDAAHADHDDVRAVLALHQLDGWLLYDDGGANRIAMEVVKPSGVASHPWFVLIPANGSARILCHVDDAPLLSHVAGDKRSYTTARERRGGLRELVAGMNKVAMEYAPTVNIPELTRVDRATVRAVERNRVVVVSSAKLVQFTKSLWKPEGRLSHYIVAHHLHRVSVEAMAHIADENGARRPVSEGSVRDFVRKRMFVRGVRGNVVVAAGSHTADPDYVIPAAGGAPIRAGDVVVVTTWGTMLGSTRPIFANLTWVGYVGDTVPDDVRGAFSACAQARDAAIEFVGKRIAKRRPVRGFEVDRVARAVMKAAGYETNYTRRTGHSIDTRVVGDGANLDDHKSRDTRTLVAGSGVTVEPGVYFSGVFGVRTEVNVFVGPGGVEVTSPRQTEVELIQ